MNRPLDASLIEINTHALGKFVFCPRAGVLAFESGLDDEGSEQLPSPRLDHLPLFDVALMNERFKEAIDRLFNTVVATFVFSAVLLILGLIVPTLALFLSLLLLVVGRKAYLHWSDYRELKRRISLHSAATASKLGDPHAGVRQINWWGLCKDEEFQSITPLARFTDPELGLSGKPARLASYRGGRIPVILHYGELDAPKPYHRIRLAAYALLIEKNQRGLPVQWGIILDPTSMRGLAVPLDEHDRPEAIEKIKAFRRDLIETTNGTDPLPPPERFCSSCPHGLPIVHVVGKTDTKKNGKVVKPRINRAEKGQKCHSQCGDRFDWVPPHSEAIEKGFK